MSNTAQYQCKSCGFSTNNPVVFNLHPCRPGRRVNWNEGIIAIIAAIIIALALLRSVSAQDAPAPQPTPSVGEPPTLLHLVYLPIVASGQDVKAAVSWCPTCRY